MQLIDGKKIAAEIRGDLKQQIASLKERGVTPGLATILIGEDAASHVYVSNKIKACDELGIRSFHHALSATVTAEEIVHLIRNLNGDSQVHGILLQLPLPKSLIDATDRCINEIDPAKDVDGLHPQNIGRLCAAKNWSAIEQQNMLVSCTPLGVIYMLKKSGLPIAGKRVVIVGRSNLFGKPAALLFLANDATVTMAHSKTVDLPSVCREADILVAAIGKPRFITAAHIKPGAVVLDVGINRTPEGIKGDVDFDAVKAVAGWLTPVPGGVGATTITMLMHNTIAAARRLAQ
jgi:methylenetetrahydrofolate dehydrogenase (NADP+)/methenyltetrahydrofolate cyclohydrolase